MGIPGPDCLWSTSMTIPIYQLDAFTDRPFGGNPAAVCLLDGWLPDATLQAVAAENNLSETAFLVPEGKGWEIRWFTPAAEVDLCGHATLASAGVVFRHLAPEAERVVFRSRHSGELPVTRDGDTLFLDFPARPPQEVDVTDALAEALGARPAAAVRSRDLYAVFDDAETVRRLAPDIDALRPLNDFAVGVTAPGTGEDGDVDFVSRFFAPNQGIPEDPVTGSAHSSLTPYWADRLGKTAMRARQVSARGGELRAELRGDRVLIGGQVVEVIRGTLTVP
jgi:PhzF family phenazine biosynthesis protein